MMDIHFEGDERLMQLFDIFKHPQTTWEGLELFHDKYMDSSLSREQVFEKYFPELEKAFNLKIKKSC